MLKQHNCDLEDHRSELGVLVLQWNAVYDSVTILVDVVHGLHEHDVLLARSKHLLETLLEHLKRQC